MIELNLTSLIQLLNFLVLFFVLKKLLFDRFFDIVDKRKELVKSELEKAESLRKEAEKYKAEHQKELSEAHEKAAMIVAAAEKQAEKILFDAKDKAKAEAARILTTAEAQIVQEREKAMGEIQSVVIATAVEIALRILGKEMDEEARRHYTKKVMENLGDMR
ncbi:ATP synthase F0 subunit B [Kosmotoga arenicorallina S304]|uniref:ATP synthase subunit b n=1 Tax=Kosmotoga arenicorallina S304 TaxID=1453497 RepID=A0A176JXL1_9BACT|nr:F0F1 ATP synthase subunit B [Kosmotoga arenicorallina]OAA28464.1 ATP synthase F0 subunit B [Kosmotoga arenicorallina S304]